ncbi:hypothetical protein DRN63_03145 [Nanoarchaeota archaeon]|nr:MAG: hypothetical protein DRN63_03145 [Nanoarchaeota archaeon]
MAKSKDRSRKYRNPIPIRVGKYHSTKKGKRGYKREVEKQAVKKMLDEELNGCLELEVQYDN